MIFLIICQRLPWSIMHDYLLSCRRHQRKGAEAKPFYTYDLWLISKYIFVTFQLLWQNTMAKTAPIFAIKFQWDKSLSRWGSYRRGGWWITLRSHILNCNHEAERKKKIKRHLESLNCESLPPVTYSPQRAASPKPPNQHHQLGTSI